MTHDGDATTLLVVGCNPPTTSGVRTRARAELAREILRFDLVRLDNMFSEATYRTGGLAAFPGDDQPWLASRQALEESLDTSDGVLLAYGVSLPAGDARQAFRQQIEWLETEISKHAHPVWWVGAAPRHPSRWQRYTYRVHPELLFSEALPLALQRRA